MDQELADIPEEARQAVKALFDKFDQSIEEVSRVAVERENMSFDQLAQEMGYHVSAGA